ncbi:PilZ domain-containing protein [Desulfocurvus sp.]|jgi:hypothetical protein|uniref:PilZ domain-containing protein n=1 Tax=Desulfocurvus sp. TaxID=2871698 RepID=UPI0025BB8342|nr:PilZ domain-containing protein [Desulfocurvus sp.]MCK9240826.1 PilZ domain-containing protein [Desulfocurvus sp.]
MTAHAQDAPSDSDMERRRHLRITLKAYGLNHVCALRLDGTTREAFIVDISAGGARLRPKDGRPAPGRGQVLELETRFRGVSEADGRRRGVVRWAAGEEFGMAFDQELPYGVSDLQCLLDGGAAAGPGAGCHLGAKEL